MTDDLLNNITRSTNVSHSTSNYDFYIGLSLAISSSVFIGSSFILKKKGLIKLSSQGNNQAQKGLRAAQGGHGYLKEWTWWSGFLTMGLGELCNFAAYGFVPATLVTPLGALSVLVSAVLAANFLDEKLNTIGKIGCMLTAVGSTVLVIHAPKEGEINSLNELLYKLLDIEFVIYVVLSIISLFVLIYSLVPKYGNTNVLIYILICSILGSYTVMCCKGVSLGLKEIASGKPTAPYSYTLLFVFLAVVCIVIQINYLNMSLDIFNTAIVTTVYYVLFSLFVMIASALLFKELMNVGFQDFVGCMCGFSTIICALCLIHFFKSDEDSKNFTESFRKTNEIILSNTSDIESNNNEQPVNDNGLFANLTKKQQQQQVNETFVQEHTRNTSFQNLDIENKNKNTNFSFMNYLSNNYKNLESKYFSRYKNSNYTNYNYNKLMSNEATDDLSNQSTNNEPDSLHTSFIDKQYRIKDSKGSKNLRHFTAFSDSDEQNKNLIESVKAYDDHPEESLPLNV